MSPVHQDRSADAAVAALESLPAPGAAEASGVAVGFRPARTLPFGVEVRRQLKRRRTQFTLGFMVLLPVILAIAFAVGGDGGGGRSGSTRASIVDLAQNGAGNFAMVTMIFSASFLLIVVISLFFGDTIASEASWSSLRYLLAAPVPRSRLVRQKAIVAGLLAVAAVVLLPAVSLLVGTLAYGTGDLVSPTGESLTWAAGAGRVLAGGVYVAVYLSWVAALALLLSVSTDAPLGAVGGAVMASILSQILDQITALEGLRDYLPTHYATAWANLLASQPDWGDMTRGVFSSLCWATVFGAAALWRFGRKDVTS